MEKFFQLIEDKTHLPVEVQAVVMTLIIGAIVIRIIRTIVRKMLEKSSLDEASYVVILRTVRIICWILLGLSALIAAGVNPSPYIAVLASVGAAIALALKDSLSNVAGGIIILFTRPFIKGDEIEVDGVSGLVDYIDLMTTRMHTFSNQEITIPNSKLVNSILINRTGRAIVRVDCKFMVSYDSDLAKVRELLNNIVETGEVLLENPAPVIGISAQEESGIVWDMLVWTTTENRFKAKYYLMEEVKKTFDENGITIPYPHMDVIIEGEDRQAK